MRGWSQRELAKRSGVSQSRISLIERGLASATAHEHERLARVLGRNSSAPLGDRSATDVHRAMTQLRVRHRCFAARRLRREARSWGLLTRAEAVRETVCDLFLGCETILDSLESAAIKLFKVALLIYVLCKIAQNH
jgi:transcriptional regulator with XRE-family HTH domain